MHQCLVSVFPLSWIELLEKGRKKEVGVDGVRREKVREEGERKEEEVSVGVSSREKGMREKVLETYMVIIII